MIQNAASSVDEGSSIRDLSFDLGSVMGVTDDAIKGCDRMRVQDLGVIDDQVLVFGGPYSNLQATEAVLAEVGARGAYAICTGDVVAYCGRPAETVAAIRAAGCPVVAGNCEIQLAQGAADCGCGFEEGSSCDLLSVGWYRFADVQIGSEDRNWMRALPDIITFSHCGARYGVIHGGVTDVARFLWSTSPADAFEVEYRALEAIIGPLDHVISGHSGIPFRRPVGTGEWINAGVVGMPPHDGSCDTAYATLTSGQLSLHRLKYDVGGAVRDMEAAGLTHGYHEALRSGHWPSEDVLPPDLRLSLASG
ncbi:metallophosphoesterase family protein [uncultured Tateyamaria sp.]|uniref:metallophosphoesterase family protein n=1 Tax=uncultured Tateyamaria sp. TaxID=455651 RepID=UPI0026274D42|nr:metallophosphoesterase family protein [uncultured Tateyamaria sp.]